jgi:hypothetical protein
MNLTHVLVRLKSNEFVEDYSCPECDKAYPALVLDLLSRASDKPKRLYREALRIMEDGYARYAGPLVAQLASIEGHEPRVAELRRRIEEQLNGRTKTSKEGTSCN